MDIEYLKIEPPNVVKEELEIDQSENFEVKLENEEKSQTMGEDFIFGEKKPSTSTIVKKKVNMIMIENYETKLEDEEKPQVMEKVRLDKKKPVSFKTGGFEFKDMKLYKCFHCGYRKALMEMVKTPETEKEIMKWSNILGKKFCKNFTIRSPICRSHFIDEFGDSRLIDVVRGNKIVETKLGDRLKCCYCGNSRMARSMTRVPKDEYTFVEWAKILGKHFQEHFGRIKNGFICRTHFNTEWDGQRPKHLLPVAVEKKLKQNINTYLDENITETMLAEKKIVCTYCEELKLSHKVTKISQQPNNLKTWRDILGEDFYKRALSQKSAYICLIHFDIEWQEHHRKLLLANQDSGENVVIVREENISGSMFDEKKKTCVYCRTSKPRRDMTLTPLNPNTLKQWADILGDEFYKKASSKQGTYICRSHFNHNWLGQRPKYVLPVDDENKCEKSVDKVPDKTITGTNLAEKKVKKHRRPQSPFPCFESVLFNQDKSKTSTVQMDGNIEKRNPYTILSTCAYCGGTKPYRVLTMVPRDPLVLKKWGDVLGEEFYRRAQENVFTSICRSHFDVGWVNIRPCNLLPHAEPVRESLHQVEHTVKESPLTKINLALKSLEDTFSSENVKLEEPDIDENPDEKPLLLLDEYIKPEAQNQEFEIEAELENKLEVPSSDEQTNQDGSLNTKRIKLEVKEEKSDD